MQILYHIRMTQSHAVLFSCATSLGKSRRGTLYTIYLYLDRVRHDLHYSAEDLC